MNAKVKILVRCAVHAGAIVLVPQYSALVPIGIEAFGAVMELTKEWIEAYKETADKNQINNSLELTSTDTINLCLNRPLTDRERDNFFTNTSVFEDLYGKIDVTFERIDMSDDSLELDVYFDEEVPVEEAAKLAILIDDYLKTFTDDLEVEEVYVS